MYSTETVEKAIAEFYYSLTARKEAHQWLTGFQLSSEAWDMCWQLLQSNIPEVRFFGATTLHMKISRYWFELPPDQVENLRRKIFDYILSHASDPKMMLIRMSIVLSSFVIQTIGEKWKTAIDDIVETFKPENFPQLSPENVMQILIQTLTVLPEEFNTIVLPCPNRGLVRHSMEVSSNKVLFAVHEVLRSQCQCDLRLQAIKCLSSWVLFGVPLPDIEPVLPSLMAAVTDEDLFEPALECVVHIFTRHDVEKYPESLQRLLSLILQLEGLLDMCINKKDYDKCHHIYCMFISVAENQVKLILDNVLKDGQHRENSRRLVGIILKCSAFSGQYPVDENISSITFNFWYTLQDEIYSYEPNESYVLKCYFRQVFIDLVETLIVKGALPTEEELASWTADDREPFRCYRQDIADCFVYCYNILRESMLEWLIYRLEYLMEHIKKTGDRSALKHLESCLYCFESIAERISDYENNYINRLFLNCLLEITKFDVKLASATLNVIGAYSTWIKYHPDVLSVVMPVITIGLKNSALVASATRALKDMSRECQTNLRPYATELLCDSKALLLSPEIKSNVRVRLMCIIGRLSSTLNTDEILGYLAEILAPYFQELERLSSAASTPTDESLLLVILNMLAVLATNLDVKCLLDEDEEEEMQTKVLNPSQPQPLLFVMQKLLPIIEKVAIKWISHQPVTESICELLKRSVSTLLSDSLPLIRDILKIIVYLNELAPRAPLLDLMKLLLMLFGNDKNQVDDLRLALKSILNATLRTLESNMHDNTDLVQGCMETLTRILKKTSILMHPDFNLSALFHCAVVAVSLPEAHTVKAASSFLTTFMTQSVDSTQQNNPSLNHHSMAIIVNTYGESLVEICLKCIGGDAPRGVMDHISEILLALNKNYFEQLCSWMSTLIKRENFPSPRVSQQQKEDYTRSILKERVNKTKLKEVIRAYTLACRGLSGTEYGNQTKAYL